jgi:hypothetical protein
MYSSLFSAILFAASLLAILLMVASKKRKADAGQSTLAFGQKENDVEQLAKLAAPTAVLKVKVQ